MLSDSPSLQEILWNFSRFKDERKRLTLMENPYFYDQYQLPTSPEAYDDKFERYPTKDFWFARQWGQKLYVLTDKPEPVYIMTDSSRSFGNFWCPKKAIIFKGSIGHLVLVFLCVSDILPDIRGRLRGEAIVKKSLEDTPCGFCKRLPASTIPKASGNRHGLQPIVTQGCPLMGWKCSIGSLSTHTSVDVGLRICTGAASDSPVCCDLLHIQLRLLTRRSS